MGVYGCVGLCRAMLGYVGLCKAIGSNVCHILANGEPLYDAYTTYLPTRIISKKKTAVHENSFATLFFLNFPIEW